MNVNNGKPSYDGLKNSICNSSYKKSHQRYNNDSYHNCPNVTNKHQHPLGIYYRLYLHFNSRI